MLKYLRFLIIILFGGLVACEKHDSLPNIVLIMADDMGYECLGCNGNTEYHTPNLDRLAEQGIRFDNCYSQPLCTPSRVKLMTGKYNFRNYEDFGYVITSYSIHYTKLYDQINSQNIKSWKIQISLKGL